MAVKPIRLFGDPVLRTPAEPVVDFDKELRKLVRDLTDTMLDADGAGVAVGVAAAVAVGDAVAGSADGLDDSATSAWASGNNCVATSG